jgi:hypothetical protein
MTRPGISRGPVTTNQLPPHAPALHYPWRPQPSPRLGASLHTPPCQHHQGPSHHELAEEGEQVDHKRRERNARRGHARPGAAAVVARAAAALGHLLCTAGGGFKGAGGRGRLEQGGATRWRSGAAMTSRHPDCERELAFGCIAAGSPHRGTTMCRRDALQTLIIT